MKKSVKNSVKTTSKKTEIESFLSVIKNHYENANMSQNRALFEKPKESSASAGTLKIYDKETLADYNREYSRWYQDGKRGKEPVNPSPTRTYVFYASTTDSTRLGSISIYGTDLNREHTRLQLRGYIFGHKVLRVEQKQGRRPFLDITLQITASGRR